MVTRKQLEDKAHGWIESFGMKLIARFIMPILISGIGFLIANTLQNINASIASLKNDNNTAIANLWSAQRATAQALSATTSRLEVLYERVDLNRKWSEGTDKRQSDSIDSLGKRLDDMIKMPPKLKN